MTPTDLTRHFEGGCWQGDSSEVRISQDLVYDRRVLVEGTLGRRIICTPEIVLVIVGRHEGTDDRQIGGRVFALFAIIVSDERRGTTIGEPASVICGRVSSSAWRAQAALSVRPDAAFDHTGRAPPQAPGFLRDG
jgi:hypothetical protein